MKTVPQTPWIFDESRIVQTTPYMSTQRWLDIALNTPGMWVLLGDPGVGKTFGVAAYALRNGINYILPPPDRDLTTRKFMRYLAQHIAQDYDLKMDPFFWLCEWCEQTLLAKLIIDEAVRLNRACFDAIRDLYDRYPFSVLFVGTNNLEQKLAYYDTIVHRVTGVWRVPPLGEDDIYMLFPGIDRATVATIHQFTRGNFRHIALIAQRLEQVQPNSIDTKTVSNIAKSCIIGGSK